MLSSLRAIVLLLATLQLTAAFPATPSYKRHSTHRTRAINGQKITSFHPTSTFEVYERGLERRSLSSSNKSPSFRDAGFDFVHNKLGFADDDEDDQMEVSSEYEGPAANHVWFRQKYRGIPVANTLANVALNSNGDVLSYSSNFVKAKKSGGNSFASGGGNAVVYNTKPKMSTDDAVNSAAKILGGRRDANREPALSFLAQEDGSLKLTHAVRMHVEHGHVVEAYVSDDDGDVIGLVDYTAELDIRAGHELLKNVGDKKSSPDGWNKAGADTYKATVGNNVLAAKGDPTQLSVDQLISLAANMTGDDTFDYKFDPYADPATGDNLAAATVNAWYVANMAHDILYRYGFTEKSFNFQDNNGDRGGKASDVVFLSVQDESGTNNANFVTLPDGEPGLMRMFLWDAFNPMRDGDLTNSVILHEYTHGLTNRMTGGGTAQCLQSVEARGLGEGWSDAFADWVFQSSGTHIKEFAIGGYVSGSPDGIRSHPYSHNRATNPLTYANVKDSEEEHTIGEVWAQTLHNVLVGLVRQLGGATDAATNPDADNGHAVFLHLFVDSLALQPCNPDFLSARLAYIQADQNRYQGKHKCALWQSFAYMGLGEGAANFVNSYKVPQECK
ncbi:Fungalysin metallopeptidase-domain-containing protein [Auriculariales sp. MPI-PUGE-AT-0066]|nr:Fungalysin metallopeptidase-domain-containing protein [Auriculariales sp. MPI-PUGE-AT-0066]